MLESSTRYYTEQEKPHHQSHALLWELLVKITIYNNLDHICIFSIGNQEKELVI